MLKRGVSPVVATVLLLVLTVAIAGVIFSVVLPFVSKSLGNSKACLDVLDGAEFPESRFNCYTVVTSTNPSETGFSIKLNKDEISGFRVSLLDSNGNSDVYDIKEGVVNPKLKMVAGTYGNLLEFPSVGGQRTYVSNKNYINAEISPIAKTGEICAVSDVLEFAPCAGDVVF